jgi:hypothetical protein
MDRRPQIAGTHLQIGLFIFRFHYPFVEYKRSERQESGQKGQQRLQKGDASCEQRIQDRQHIQHEQNAVDHACPCNSFIGKCKKMLASPVT